MYVLEVMSGPLDGTRWRFDHEITIGRDDAFASACVAIDRYLSRAHARLQVDAGTLTLTDLTSRNGTTVGGRVVTSEELSVGQRFTCGRTMMRVIVATSLEAPAPPIRIDAALEVITTVADMRLRRPSGPIGFVPTMGALHEGHLALIDRAKEDSAGVVVSIFVNPLQFAAGEDFERYPRDLDRDIELIEQRGATVLFAPEAADLYGPDFATTVDVGDLGRRYEGEARPTHFSGVATVIAKLIHVVAPTRLYLGQKDAQQVAVITRLVRDLALPCDIVIVPTEREADGLARSSRNVYLSPEERKRAPLLYRALTNVARAYRDGASREEAVARGVSHFTPDASAMGVSEALQYIEIVDPIAFVPVDDAREDRETALIIGALKLGAVRLLDNVRASDV